MSKITTPMLSPTPAASNAISDLPSSGIGILLTSNNDNNPTCSKVTGIQHCNNCDVKTIAFMLIATSFKNNKDNTRSQFNMSMHPAPVAAHNNKLNELVTYDPDHLLDSLIQKLLLKNDAALARALEVAPPVISKIRHRRLPVGATLLIRMHEISDLTIGELRSLMGDQRARYGMNDKPFQPKDI
jgi:hypothetical protein